MKRRKFIALLGGAAAGWPLAAHAQQPAKVPRVGILSPAASESAATLTAFRERIRDLGYIEGQTIAFDFRLSKGTMDALPALAAELVRIPVNVIVTDSTNGTLAAFAATRTIPIVMGATGGDPVALGLAKSLSRPGGNVTGTNFLAGLSDKRLQLLKQAFPGAQRVAVLANPTGAISVSEMPKAELIGLLVNPASPVAEPQIREAQAAAHVLGVRLTVLSAVSESDFDQVFVSLAQQRADALFVSADPFFASKREHLVALAAEHAMPATYEFREFVEAGGLMSYGTVLSDGFYKGGNYVGKVLKGTRPADLPVEQVDKFELVINLKTAKALGLTVPDKVLGLADEAIE